MRLVRWLRRGFHAGRLMEPGEEALISDDVILGEHMLDVASGEAGPARERVPDAVFRADLAQAAAMPVAAPVVVAAVPTPAAEPAAEPVATLSPEPPAAS